MSELKILILEANPADAELLQRLLKRGGLQFEAVVAGDEQEFHHALLGDGFHVVLADNALPQYSSSEALKLLRAINPHVAFILVTGTVSEEFAVNIIQQGADDYILKTNLTRLPSAINNAIDKKKVQIEMEQEKELSNSIVNSLPGIIYLFNEQGRFIRWNKNLERATLYSVTELSNMTPADLFELPDGNLTPARIRETFVTGYSETEASLITKSKERIPYFLTGTAVTYAGQACLIGVGLDVTATKQSEIELKQMNDQLRSLSQHLHTVREEEKRRIARELHDELGQLITGLKIDVSWLQKGINSNRDAIGLLDKLNEMNGILDHVVKTIRKISSELHPSILEDLGLAEALDWQGQAFAKRFDIPVDFYADEEVRHLRIDITIATNLYRIYQESLTNVARHAEATRVKSRLLYTEGTIRLTIADNGKGFVNSGERAKNTLGVLGMKERSLMMGGSFDIQSDAGKGTKISIVVPVK